MTEVREITESPLIRANCVMSASVIPSAKYSWLRSADKFSNGSTASERIGSCAGGVDTFLWNANPVSSAIDNAMAAQRHQEVPLPWAALARALRGGASSRSTGARKR